MTIEELQSILDNAKTKSEGSHSIFLTLLTVMFIGFKITGIITWSWVWVLSPLWIPMAIAIIVVAIALLYIKLSTK